LNLDAQHEIRKEPDGSYAIYLDPENPVAGGTGFKTHEAAEKWLQKYLGIDKKAKGKKDDASQPSTEPPAVPAANLKEAIAAFKAAAIAETAREGGTWEAGWDAIVAKYPRAFVDENYAELSGAYADGWEEGQGTED
jgi:hypothetical protein